MINKPFIIKLLVVLLLVILYKNYCLANFSVSGKALSYKGKTIKAFYYDNYFTLNQVLLSQSVINENGDFNLELSLSEERHVFLKIGNYKVDFYAEPNKAITLEIGEPDSTMPNLVNQDIPVEYTVKDSELNALISKLGADIDWFITQNYQRFLLKNVKPVCDTFVAYLQKQYAVITNPFFQKVLKYRLGLLELAAYHSNQYIINQYLSGPIEYTNYDYFDLFNQLFHHYLLQFSETAKGDKIYKIINQTGSYSQVFEIFKTDNTIMNDTLRELVLIKGLMEFYYNPDYNKPAVLECIKQASVFALSPKNRNLALLVYERLTRFYKGNPTPDFELPDITNQQNRLSKFKGKVVILSFGASWSSDYFSELLVLEKYSKNFGKKVLILNILIDTPNTVLINKHEQNKNWKLLLAENHNEILDLYNVKSVPQFFIISKGGWFIEAPSEPPSKWSVEKFEAFLKLK